MGNRLTKIYTRTGDDGTTGMADGSRVSKSDLVFAVMGDVDELNAHIGMILAQLQTLTEDKKQNFITVTQSLNTLQHLLFNIGGELAMPQYIGIAEAHISWLESQIDDFNKNLSPLKDFILPAGSTLVSQVHIARTVCRRAERQAVKLRQNNDQAISSAALKLLNRLSDWLFVLARYSAKAEDSKEVLWDKTLLEQFGH